MDVEIIATNGARWRTTIDPQQSVESVRAGGLAHFVEAGEMSDADVRLCLIRNGAAHDLPDTATLAEVGVAAGAVLALMVRGMQVDA